MGLFTPAWKSENRLKAVNAARNCKNQKTLGRIAREAKVFEAQKTAVERLTDQQELFSVALTGSGVADAAIRRMTDQTLLARAAQTPAMFRTLREAAASKLTDQAALEKIALTDEEETVRVAAMKRMSDVNRRVEIALADPGREAHYLAAKEWITDQDELIRLARNDPDKMVQAHAIPRIADERTRAELALFNDWVSNDERVSALDVLRPDDATLEKLAEGKTDHYFRMIVTKRLHDQDALMRVIDGESLSSDVIRAAVENITDRDKLLILLGGEKTVKYAMPRARELKMLDEEALERLHPSAREKGQLERDRASFLQKLSALGGGPVVEAYLKKDVDALKAIAAADAEKTEPIEAMILLLREYGEEKGEPSGLAYKVNWALTELWRKGGETRRAAVKEANRWPVRSHGDHGSGSCHEDSGPIVFDFK